MEVLKRIINDLEEVKEDILGNLYEPYNERQIKISGIDIAIDVIKDRISEEEKIILMED